MRRLSGTEFASRAAEAARLGVTLGAQLAGGALGVVRSTAESLVQGVERAAGLGGEPHPYERAARDAARGGVRSATVRFERSGSLDEDLDAPYEALGLDEEVELDEEVVDDERIGAPDPYGLEEEPVDDELEEAALEEAGADEADVVERVGLDAERTGAPGDDELEAEVELEAVAALEPEGQLEPEEEPEGVEEPEAEAELGPKLEAAGEPRTEVERAADAELEREATAGIDEALEREAEVDGEAAAREAGAAGARDDEALAAAPRPAAPEEDHVDSGVALVGEFAEAGAEEGAGAEVEVAEPWDGYARMTAAEVRRRLTDAAPATLTAVTLYERAHRARKSVLADAERRIARGAARP